jgi:hypothetical protein
MTVEAGRERMAVPVAIMSRCLILIFKVEIRIDRVLILHFTLCEKLSGSWLFPAIRALRYHPTSQAQNIILSASVQTYQRENARFTCWRPIR